MIGLYEYLLSKENPKLSTFGFPTKPIKDDIVEFLIQNGFKRLHTTGITYPVKELQDQTSAAFIINLTNDRTKEYWIRFIDPKVSKNVFFCRASMNGDISSDDVAYIEYDSRGATDDKFEDFIKFKKEVDKIFNW